MSMAEEETTVFNIGKQVTAEHDVQEKFRISITIDQAKLTDTKLLAVLEGIEHGFLGWDEQKHFLITGGSDPASIGCALAKKVLEAGSLVYLAGSRELGEIEKLAAALVAEVGSGSVVPMRLDQGSLEDLNALLAYAKENKITFDCILPFGAKHNPKLFFQIREEDMERLFHINVLGIYFLATQLPRLTSKKRPWKMVLPLSVNDGRIPASGFYPATKKALEPLVKQCNKELAFRKNGAVIGVRMGWTRSAMMQDLERFISHAHKEGVVTFTTDEMADIILLSLVEPTSFNEPTVFDATGNLHALAYADVQAIFSAEN
jgi:NAD(P)-dependent dehydrogenase (short-subunit alcohol dehydrogenase family)